MTALVVLPDLEFGGGQAFAVRLANALGRERRVLMTVTNPARVDASFAARIAPDVRLVLNEGGAHGVARIIADEGVTAVNSHLWWADRATLGALRGHDIAWVVSMHGCYEILLEHPDAEPRFREEAAEVLARATRVCIAAEKNRRIFDELRVPQDRVERVPYGFEFTAPSAVRRPDADIVFGVVARAFPGKGWEESVVAFRQVRARLKGAGLTSALVLVGDGPVADALRGMDEPDVVLTGWSPTPEEHIAGFDIALLPTSFAGESFPNAIIEYLALGKPIIATRWAEIPSMVGDGRSDPGAAVLIELDRNRKADVAALRDAMIELALDPVRRQALAGKASARGSAFSMETCVARYRDALRTKSATCCPRG